MIDEVVFDNWSLYLLFEKWENIIWQWDIHNAVLNIKKNRQTSDI